MQYFYFNSAVKSKFSFNFKSEICFKILFATLLDYRKATLSFSPPKKRIYSLNLALHKTR